MTGRSLRLIGLSAGGSIPLAPVAIVALFLVTSVKVASLAAKAELALLAPCNESKEVITMEKTNTKSIKRLALLSHSILESIWAMMASGSAGVLLGEDCRWSRFTTLLAGAR